MTSRPVQCSGKKAVFTTMALSLLMSLPAVSQAESVKTSEWNISADRIIRYEDPQSIIAEGNIVLEKRVKMPPQLKQSETTGSSWAELLGEPVEKKVETAAEIEEQLESEGEYRTKFLIQADWMAYDVEHQTIKARGNVKVQSDEDTLLADQGRVKLDTETGTFTDAIIIRKEDQLHLEGKEIEKTGLNTYRIKDGWVITCKVGEGETPPWSFASSDTKIVEDGYAVLKHATFNIKGVPVLYTPYMVVPVKNTRQTGFLFPEVGNSTNGGFNINTPFFYNLSDSMDITLFPEIYENRGFMPGIEFRYVRDEFDKGTFIASYLDDNLSDPDEVDYYNDTDFTHTNSDRYWVRGKADHTVGDDWQVRLDVDIVSDRDYLTEFNAGYTGFEDSDERFFETYGRGFENKTDDTRDNTLKFLKTWSGMSLEGDLLAVNDVRVTESSPTPLWKLPDIKFSGVRPIGETRASFEWNTDYINYWREDGVGANRVDLHPTISSSVPLSPYLESRAELGVRDTFYIVQEYGDGVWANDENQNRLTADFEFEVATTLLRNFALTGKTYNAFDHQLHPYIRYNYIPDVDQEDLPSFDSVDFIEETNAITYGVDNFFNVFSGENSQELGYFKILQSYFLTDVDADEQFSDISMRLGVTPVKSLYVEYETDLSVYGDGFVRHSLEGQYTNSRGDYFNLDYSFNKTGDFEQINAIVGAQLLAQWFAEVDIEHSISESETIEADVSLVYSALCWSIEFQSKYTPTDTRFMMVFNLANLGNPLGIKL